MTTTTVRRKEAEAATTTATTPTIPTPTMTKRRWTKATAAAAAAAAAVDSDDSDDSDGSDDSDDSSDDSDSDDDEEEEPAAAAAPSKKVAGRTSNSAALKKARASDAGARCAPAADSDDDAIATTTIATTATRRTAATTQRRRERRRTGAGACAAACGAATQRRVPAAAVPDRRGSANRFVQHALGPSPLSRAAPAAPPPQKQAEEEEEEEDSDDSDGDDDDDDEDDDEEEAPGYGEAWGEEEPESVRAARWEEERQRRLAEEEAAWPCPLFAPRQPGDRRHNADAAAAPPAAADDDVDPDSLEPLVGAAAVGDVLFFKMVALGDDWKPTVSGWREATVVAAPSGGALSLRLITDGDDEIIEQQQADLVDVRLVSREVDAMMAAAAPAPAPAPTVEAAAPAPAPAPAAAGSAYTYDKAASVLKQVQYYFSDENLAGDSFMREKIAADPEGWVPLAVVLNFQRRARMQLSVEEAAGLLGASTVVVVGARGERLRRRAPLAPQVGASLLLGGATLEARKASLLDALGA